MTPPQVTSPEVTLPEVPDLSTVLKILWLATKQKYHHVVLFALLINELGVLATVGVL